MHDGGNRISNGGVCDFDEFEKDIEDPVAVLHEFRLGHFFEAGDNDGINQRNESVDFAFDFVDESVSDLNSDSSKFGFFCDVSVYNIAAEESEFGSASVQFFILYIEIIAIKFD